MSIQFNYFAINEDENIVCENIVSIFENLYIIPERGTKEEMIARQISGADDLYLKSKGNMVCLVAEDFVDFIKLRELSENLYRVDFQEFPCLEYSPSVVISEDTVKAGRVVCFFDNDATFKAKVQNLFKLLKKKSQKLKEKSGFWIFEYTARNASKLRYWVGPPRNNPFYEDQ